MYEFNVSATYFHSTTHLFDRNYSTLVVELVLRRDSPARLIGVYFPTALLLLSSTLTFWFGVNTTEERNEVGVMVLLTLVMFHLDVREQLPEFDQPTSLDAWFVTCMLFNFLQVLEAVLVDYSYVQARIRLHRQRRQLAARYELVLSKSYIKRILYKKFERKHAEGNRLKKQWLKRKVYLSHEKYYPILLDYTFRCAFPILIVLFYFVYWKYVFTLDT